jgi:hypothetical protein
LLLDLNAQRIEGEIRDVAKSATSFQLPPPVAEYVLTILSISARSSDNFGHLFVDTAAVMAIVPSLTSRNAMDVCPSRSLIV